MFFTGLPGDIINVVAPEGDEGYQGIPGRPGVIGEPGLKGQFFHPFLASW